MYSQAHLTPREWHASEDFKYLRETFITPLQGIAHRDWLRGMRQGRLDIVVALCLVQMQKLVAIEVHLQESTTVGSAIFDLIGSKLPGNLPIFPKVKFFTVSHAENDPMDEDATVVAPWPTQPTEHFRIDLQLPVLLEMSHVESLSLDYLCLEESRQLGNGEWPEFPTKATNLKRLVLRTNDLDEEQLKHLSK